MTSPWVILHQHELFVTSDQQQKIKLQLTIHEHQESSSLYLHLTPYLCSGVRHYREVELEGIDCIIKLWNWKMSQTIEPLHFNSNNDDEYYYCDDGCDNLNQATLTSEVVREVFSWIVNQLQTLGLDIYSVAMHYECDGYQSGKIVRKPTHLVCGHHLGKNSLDLCVSHVNRVLAEVNFDSHKDINDVHLCSLINGSYDIYQYKDNQCYETLHHATYVEYERARFLNYINDRSSNWDIGRLALGLIAYGDSDVSFKFEQHHKDAPIGEFGLLRELMDYGVSLSLLKSCIEVGRGDLSPQAMRLELSSWFQHLESTYVQHKKEYSHEQLSWSLQEYPLATEKIKALYSSHNTTPTPTRHYFHRTPKPS